MNEKRKQTKKKIEKINTNDTEVLVGNCINEEERRRKNIIDKNKIWKEKYMRLINKKIIK